MIQRAQKSKWLIYQVYYFCYMKAYFIRMFSYDNYANQLIFQAVIKANCSEKSVQLLGHLLAAQQIWLSRCKGLPAVGGALWPNWPAEVLSDLITENTTAWLKYLENLHENDFEKAISYKNSKGDQFENKLKDVLAHVINHGTHHRAQAGQILKEAGFELPVTDYIFYLRRTNN